MPSLRNGLNYFNFCILFIEFKKEGFVTLNLVLTLLSNNTGSRSYYVFDDTRFFWSGYIASARPRWRPERDARLS